MSTAEALYTGGEYAARHETWHEEDSPWKAGQIIGLLAVNGIQPLRIVEVGCGAGGVLRGVVGAFPGAEGVGYDIAPEATRLASRHESDRLTYRCADFLATEELGFDLLLCIDVFEHIEDYLGFLRALRGRAERYAFHIPLDMHVSGLLRDRQMVARSRLGHLHYFSKATALATLRDAGYEVTDWCYTRGTEELQAVHPERGLKTKAMNVVRRMLYPVAPDLAVKLTGGFSLLALAR